MGEVVPARTSPTLHPPFPRPSHCASIVVTSTVRVNIVFTCVAGAVEMAANQHADIYQQTDVQRHGGEIIRVFTKF